MMLYLLGVILSAAFITTEWNGVSERLAWPTRDRHAGRPRWRRVVNVVSYVVITTIGVTLLMTHPVRKLDTLDWMILLTFCWPGLSILWSTDRHQTIQNLGGWLGTGCAVLGVGLTCSLQECLVIVAIGAAMYCMVGFCREIWGPKVECSPDRFWGVIGCNNQAAEAVLLLFLVVYFYQIEKINIWLMILIAVGLIINIVMTRTRTVSWAAVVSALVWMSFYLDASSSALLALGCGLICLGLIAAIPPVRSRVWSMLLLGRDRKDLQTLNARTLIWSLHWPYARKHPLLGNGYCSIWTDTHQEELHKVYPFGIFIRQAHSVYLDYLLNGGIVALSLLLAAFWIAGTTAFQMSSPTGPLLFALITYAMVHGLCESTLANHGHRTFAFFAILVAMSG